MLIKGDFKVMLKYDMDGDYNPVYWVQGAYNPSRSGNFTDAQVADLIDDIYAQGWRGVLYWGASRAGSEMN